jgi:hypothetical protein
MLCLAQQSDSTTDPCEKSRLSIVAGLVEGHLPQKPTWGATIGPSEKRPARRGKRGSPSQETPIYQSLTIVVRNSVDSTAKDPAKNTALSFVVRLDSRYHIDHAIRPATREDTVIVAAPSREPFVVGANPSPSAAVWMARGGRVLLAAFVTILSVTRADAYTAELVFDREPAATSYNVYTRFEQGVGPAPTETERKATFLASALPAGSDEKIRVLVANLPVGPDAIFSVSAVRDSKESGRSNKLRLGYETIAYYIDSDGDGLLDFEEDVDLDLVVDANETDSRKADTDGDGLSDYREIYETFTNPRGSDTDGDGTIDSRDGCNDMDRDGYGSAAGSATCKWDNCPYAYNPSQTDSDYDSQGEACDPCTNVGGFQNFDSRRVAVTFGKVYQDRTVGNDTMAVRGEFELPTATSFGMLDPSVEGARILVESVGGVALVDIKLPAGKKEPGVLRGWKIDPRGNKFRYIDQSGDRIDGIVKLVAKNMSKKAPRRVRVAVKGRNGNYPVAPELSPLRVIVVLGNSDASKRGGCGETAFKSDGCRLTSHKMLACR